MSYSITLRGHWFYIIVLNVHAPTQVKNDNMKDSFYEEIEHICDKFPKYHMNILIEVFSAKVDREDIVKLIIRNESLHEIINDNLVTVVNFATFKNVIFRSTMFQYHNICKFTRTTPNGKAQSNQPYFDKQEKEFKCQAFQDSGL
jgi:hypothetical protein